MEIAAPKQIMNNKRIPYLSIIIPAYNEENIIKETINDVLVYLHSQNFDFEIIVVNDGSLDSTQKVVSELSSDNPEIIIINLERNSGKGFAVKTGILSANGKFRLFMDADNSTSIAHFELMKPLLESGTEVIIGSRRVKGANIAVPQNWFRNNLGRLFNIFVKLINGLPYNDTQAGFKLFSNDAAVQIFNKQTLHRWAFDIELLMLAAKLGYEIKEIPITWINNTNSHVTVSGMAKMLWDILILRLNDNDM